MSILLGEPRVPSIRSEPSLIIAEPSEPSEPSQEDEEEEHQQQYKKVEKIIDEAQHVPVMKATAQDAPSLALAPA
jgi:hypothetical protein